MERKRALADPKFAHLRLNNSGSAIQKNQMAMANRLAKNMTARMAITRPM
jgi:hypothetical protein